jgi:hypothetical protein
MGGERGGQGIIKKKKNKRGIRNYPIPNYYNIRKYPISIGPVAGIHFQPSDLTLEEHLKSDRYKEFIKSRGIEKSPNPS